MANALRVDETGTFSRLVPVSRCVSFQHPPQSRDRIVPAPCLNSSTRECNQSPGTPERHRAADVVTEMAAVQSSYTDAIRSQQLSPSARDLYRLVASLAKYASGSDEHPFTPSDASDAVRCIDQYVRETASDLHATNQGLSKMTEDTRLYRFHAVMGDYPGHLCKVLKEGWDSSKISQQPWTIIVQKLDKEEKLLAAWKASSKAASTNRPATPFREALQERVNDLVSEGWDDVDFDLALFAVRAYARRCFVAHGGAYDLFASKNFAKLAKYLEADDNSLEAVLPDEEKPQVDKFRRLLNFYRDRHIRRDDNGHWSKYVPSVKVSSPPLRGEEAFRARVDMGKFRPSGLDGPPPPNIEADLSSYRRHSVAVASVGTKRPAVEQPSGQPPTKMARGLAYPNVRAETTQDNMTNEDKMTLAELHGQLHELADKFTLISPKDAAKLYSETVPRLEKELKGARAKIEKAKNQLQRQQRRREAVQKGK